MGLKYQNDFHKSDFFDLLTVVTMPRQAPKLFIFSENGKEKRKIFEK
jgi:hypothetical protein